MVKIHNQGSYVSDLQIQKVINLMPEQIRTLKVKIYITTTKGVFRQNKFKPRLEKKIRRFLEGESEAVFYYHEKTILLFEDLLFEHCPKDFYWLFVYLLSHELRHCEQGCFFKKRWNVVLGDYKDYLGEINLYNLEELHWSEKDAYTYSYRFVVNHLSEIMDIFQLSTLHEFYPFNFDIDMQEIWESYKKEMDLLERIAWFIDDLYWRKPQMSVLPNPIANSLKAQS
ncbi:hypothetical protein [Bacillus toyonensis]|uniref:hypothetical protein n=1 Tax=Bacillus toyonensis TaxID=155322 RepID=UPI0021D0E738|nr:hypothetical protein [Bacillus toyonensis]MCU4770332.1 hypothetical protein [Bacillus toyonensis]